MFTPKLDQIGHAVDEVEAVLKGKFKATGENLEQKIASSKKRLPSKVVKSASVLAKIQRDIKHQPYVLESQQKAAEKARRNMTEFSQLAETKAKRKIGRKQWLSGLILNYGIFLALLVAFWYVATQM